ncbi:hypothetical protein MKX01_017084 [Papaver californicum]|nr:hypothetical protein MKX01_017084 [Papaver californicum]
MHCYCNGCLKKVIKSIKSFEGVEKTQRDSATNKVTIKGRRVDPFMMGYQGVDSDSFRVDKANNLIKVKGTMDVTEFTAYLKQKLKRDVDIVLTKVGDGGEEKDGDEMKENGGGGRSEKRTEGGGAAKTYGYPRAGPRQRDGYGNGYGYGYGNGYNYGPGNGYGVDPGEICWLVQNIRIRLIYSPSRKSI